MTMYVFAGPTLSGAASPDPGDDIVYLPPVSQGDVYRLVAAEPDAIGIVDGRFQDVPAVWHKEILWALNAGVPVYGSASMGALRAAELHPFGMRGVGWVFAAYRDGVLEDDDEVTVAHVGREDGYLPLSEAMVNIRRTLALAAGCGVIGTGTADALIRLAKSTFYPSRGYPGLLHDGRRAGLDTGELDALRDWLPVHRLDQKRADAVAMVRAMRDGPVAGGYRPPPFSFHHTQFFERTRRGAGDAVLDVAASDTPQPARVAVAELLDELRLDPIGYRDVRQRALARCLAVRESRHAGTGADADGVQRAADAFRRERGLLSAAATQRWMADNELSVEQFAAFIREERALHHATAAHQWELDVHIGRELRATGRYPALAARARAKRAFLAERGLDQPSSLVDEDTEDLYRWYFASRGRTVPGDVPAYCRALGFANEIAFRQAVLGEYRFRTATENGGRRPDRHAPPQ
jgi:hypothetical protein